MGNDIVWHYGPLKENPVHKGKGERKRKSHTRGKRNAQDEGRQGRDASEKIFFQTFHFEIVIDSHEVAKIVQRCLVYLFPPVITSRITLVQYQSQETGIDIKYLCSPMSFYYIFCVTNTMIKIQNYSTLTKISLVLTFLVTPALLTLVISVSVFIILTF